MLRVVVITAWQKSWMKLKVGTNSCCGYPVWGEARVQLVASCHRVVTFPDLSPWEKSTLAVVKDSPIFPPKRQKRKDLIRGTAPPHPPSFPLSLPFSPLLSLSSLPQSLFWDKFRAGSITHLPHITCPVFFLTVPSKSRPACLPHWPRRTPVSGGPFHQASCCHQRGCWNLIVHPLCADSVPLVLQEGTVAFNVKFSKGCPP